MFTVGWFGYGGSSGLVEFLFEDLEEAGIKLKTCHEYPIATAQYTPDGIFDFIDSCDIIILPARLRLQPAKSVNRLALAWSRKKACVVAPLDAYMQYVENGVNAMVASTKEEWLAAIFKLRDNAGYRDKIALAGYQTAVKKLNPRDYSDKFFDTLDKVLNPDTKTTSPFVQVIIPHYANRLDYLSHAVESIALTKGPKRDILIVSSSKINPQNADFVKKYNVRVIHVQNKLTFSEANNLGIKNANKNTTHFLLMNDDVILNDTFLDNMIDTLMENGNNFILNPYSNCDKGWLHNDILTAQSGKDLYPNMMLDSFTPEELNSFKSFGFKGDEALEKSEKLVKPSPFCAFYCTLIPKEIFDTVGMLNTIFKNGGEDLDFCERAKRFGFGCFWTKYARCFHFGGKTRKFSEDEDYKRHHDEDAVNNSLIHKRWKKSKKKIGIWTGPAWENWDLNNYREFGSGIGGSEYVEGCIAEAAAAAGNYVTLYGCVSESKTQYGVDLIPWDKFIPEEEYFDLFIASRNINCIDSRLRAKVKLAHIHDIWLISGKQISDYHLKEINKFICLSPWHKDFVKEHHNLSEDKISIIPNGVTYDWFSDLSLEKKINEVEWGRLHWSSSPDRGLDNVIYLLPWIIDRCPNIKLHVFYGFYNWISAVNKRNNKQEMESIENLKKQIEDLKEYVVFHDRVNQVNLSKEWRKAWAWFYPTNFTESSCITAREAQLSFTPTICSNVAALQTTVGDFGYRVFSNPYSKEAREEFLSKIVELYHNKDIWVEACLKSNEAVKNKEYSWDRVWKLWENFVN